MPAARSRIVLVGGAMVAGALLAACGSSTPSVGGGHRVHRQASTSPAERPSSTAAPSLRIPGQQAGELARATVTSKRQTDVVRRAAGTRRYAVRVACIATGHAGQAAYAVYETDRAAARRQALTSGGFPCDGTEYMNSVGRVRRGVQISFSRLPRQVIAGYAIVVPE